MDDDSVSSRKACRAEACADWWTGQSSLVSLKTASMILCSLVTLCYDGYCACLRCATNSIFRSMRIKSYAT